MREILFRGKRKDNGEWVEGYLFKTKEHTYIAYAEQYDDDLFYSPENIFIEVIPETVGQYTGLTDKNRKKIFKGDIVKLTFEGTSRGYDENGRTYEEDYYGHKIGIVSFGSNGTFLNVRLGELWINGEDVEGWTPTRRTRIAGYRSEVIGNIHDNPELLKEGEGK